MADSNTTTKKVTRKKTWLRRQGRKLGKWYDQSTFKHWSAFVVICLLATIMILISQVIKQAVESSGATTENMWQLFFRDIGVALFPIGLMSLIYEYILRDNFLENMKIGINEVMPKSYQRIRDSGVVDIFPNLEISERKKDIKKLENSEIRILDIWMEGLHVIEDEILLAVTERDCSLKVILWNPQKDEAIKNRAKSLKATPYYSIIGKIIDNITIINSIRDSAISHFKTRDDYEEMKDEYLKRVELKLFNCFIGASLICYGQEYYMGTYLRDKLSSQRTQFKVRDEKTFLFKELDRHFILQWNDEDNIPVDDAKFNELIMWYRNQKWDNE